MPSTPAASFSNMRCRLVHDVPRLTGAGGEAEAPRRGMERSPEAAADPTRHVVDPSFEARDDEDGCFTHVLGEVLGRAGHAGLGRVAIGVAGRDATGVGRHVAVGAERFLVHRTDRLALVGVGHDHPVPALLVRSRRRLRRDVDALPHELDRDGPIEVQPLPHRSRGRKQLVRRQLQRGSHRLILPPAPPPPEIAFEVAPLRPHCPPERRRRARRTSAAMPPGSSMSRRQVNRRTSQPAVSSRLVRIGSSSNSIS